MKIFAIYLKVALTEHPEWFDQFLRKYYESSNLHITLLQPRYVEESRIEEFKTKVSEYINKQLLTDKDREIEFGAPIIDSERNGTTTIMLPVVNSTILYTLQKDMRNLLKEFDNYIDNSKIEYEETFKPHITIGVNIGSENLQEVTSYFATPYTVRCVITDLVLPIVPDTSLEQRYNKQNLTVFSL